MNEIIEGITDSKSLASNLMATAIWVGVAYSVIFIVRAVKRVIRFGKRWDAISQWFATTTAEVAAGTIGSVESVHAIAYIESIIRKSERSIADTKFFMTVLLIMALIPECEPFRGLFFILFALLMVLLLLEARDLTLIERAVREQLYIAVYKQKPSGDALLPPRPKE